MKFIHSSLTSSLLAVCFFLFGWSTVLQGQAAINVQAVPAENPCATDQYCIDIQIQGVNGANYIGNSSIFLSYDPNVIFFDGNSITGITSGCYTSINFDGDQTSLNPDCDVANGGQGLTPYSEHGYDGLVPGNLLLSIVLSISSIELPTGNLVYACPQIENDWETVSSVCFTVIDPDGNPNIDFEGDENGVVINTQGTNFNSDSNDPADKYNNGFFTGMTLSYNELVGSSNVIGCTDPTACNYDVTATVPDNSCTYATVWYQDADGDGFGNAGVTQTACEQPAGYVSNGDDNCDGTIDCAGACNGSAVADECGVCNGPGATVWYQDADGDGLGNPAVSQSACDQPAGYVSNSSDTNDGCNGTVDECGVCNGPGATVWYQDADGDGLGNPAVSQLACDQPAGYVSNSSDDCDGTLDCAGVCNGSSVADECGVCNGPGASVWYQDADGDGLGNPAVSQSACTQPTGYVSNSDDDNDGCNGTIDECGVCGGSGPSVWYEDADGDGLGNATVSQTSCTQPTGYVSNSSDDCDGTLDCTGVCNGSAVTDECGVCNGSGASVWYQDADGDGLGNPSASQTSCTQPAGYVANSDDDNDGCSGSIDDCGVCNGDNSTCTDCAGVVNGTSVLDDCGVCNGDNSTCTDCAGVVNGTSVLDECGICDGPGASVWYQDADGDGLGNPAATQSSCTQPTGYVANSDDDNDGCSGSVDECGVCGGSGPAVWYQDADGDGLGNPAATQSSCTQPTGYVANSDDDNDGCSGAIDDCGVCGGDNSTCTDCAGVVNGTSVLDECGVCNGDNSTCTDCAGVVNGTSVVDACGVCGGDGSTCGDNDGDGFTGADDPDDNDPCNPDNTVGACDSDGDGTPDGNDCAPADASAATVDACGVCGGDGSTCTDNDGDGFTGADDPDDNDACNPDNTVGACDSDGDGTPDGNDCAPADASAATVDECGVCGGSGPSIWYQDNDGDGLGNPAATQSSCIQPAGYVANGDDTDDGCIGVEDECGVCDGPGASVWYEDADGDGLGSATVTLVSCSQPDGFVDNPNDDCDGALDCAGVCNGSSVVDECGECGGDGATVWYQDADGDGLGNPAVSESSCSQPMGYVSNSSDPDDSVTPNECGLQVVSGALCGGDNNAYFVIVTIDGPANATYTATDNNTGQQFSVIGESGSYGPYASGTGYSITISANGVANCSETVSQSIVDCNVTAIELMSFEGETQENGNNLTWATASEKNSDYFTLERSTNGQNFEPIARIEAKGNSNSIESYNFLDHTFAEKTNYYRLLETDESGNTEIVSNVIVLSREADEFAILSLMPNPAREATTLEFFAITSETMTINIYDATGQLSSVQTYNATKGFNQVTVDVNKLAAGSYLLNLTGAKQGMISTRILKQ